MTYFDLRRHTRSISTCSPEAQRWFDLRRSGLGQQYALRDATPNGSVAPKAVLPVNPRRQAAGMDLTVGPLSANSPSLST